MARKLGRGPRAFKEWRTANAVTIQTVAAAVGDDGGQLFKWASGERGLPLPLLIRVSRHTGLPLDVLAERKQMRMARELAALAADPASAA